MSDLMLHGVLNMPLLDDPAEIELFEWVQFRDCARQASKRIQSDADTIAALTAERDAERARADRAEARVAVLEVANAQLQSDLDLRNAQLEAVHEMAPAKPGLLYARLKELSEKKGPADAE